MLGSLEAILVRRHIAIRRTRVRLDRSKSLATRRAAVVVSERFPRHEVEDPGCRCPCLPSHEPAAIVTFQRCAKVAHSAPLWLEPRIFRRGLPSMRSISRPASVMRHTSGPSCSMKRLRCKALSVLRCIPSSRDAPCFTWLRSNKAKPCAFVNIPLPFHCHMHSGWP